MYKDTNENGITLVTLVVTIILLLILAGVTISYISGGGIIDRTQVAMDQYENADKKQQDIIDDIDDYNKQEVDLDPVYNEEGAEDNIAPSDLFEYEIINDGSIASSYMQNLPTKTAKITGINPNYIEIQEESYHEWYYKINYDGITDVLVIPYQVELDENGNVTENGEMYKITEVDLSVRGYKEFSKYHGSSFPSIKKVIYPNTVEKIARSEDIRLGGYGVLNQPIEIILSKNLTSIENGAFSGTPIVNIEIPDTITNISDYAFYNSSITNIKIPSSVTRIGDYAFEYCYYLTDIEIPDSVTSIGDYAFCNSGITNIIISSSVTSIGEEAFGSCYEIKEIVVPKSVKNIGDYAFSGWNSDQTIYFECSEDEAKNWESNWKSGCYAKIVWNYNPDEATE